jgi:hypothetical protein
MAEAKRRGYGEDGIYFDHRDDCRDNVRHKTCSGRWRGVVSLGFDADGKRIRKKVSGQTKAEVKDKLKALHSELDAGIRTAAAYTVEKAVADWLYEGLPGRRAAKTVEVNRDSLRPLLAVIGTIPLRDLTVQDVRSALATMAVTHSTPTLQKAHNRLTVPASCSGQGSGPPECLGVGRHPARPGGPSVAGPSRADASARLYRLRRMTSR